MKKKPTKKVKKVVKKKMVVKKKVVTKKQKVREPIRTKKSGKSTVKKIAGSSLVRTSIPAGKPIGAVIHFFTEISVAIVVFKQNVPAGTVLHFKGATTDFKQPANSMQYDHASVAVAKKGKQIGIKVKKRVREGDKVHKG